MNNLVNILNFNFYFFLEIEKVFVLFYDVIGLNEFFFII